ncbi:MAG: argininosuccinate lyase, partial [Gemmatimonadales bacterium]|nr:argininosuccinate lyase [Gemmatimonadales bacterium]
VTAEGSSSESPHKLWGGRFRGPLAASADRLNRSLPVDHRLWPQDVRVAQAWVSMLAQAGVVGPAEERTLIAGLGRVAERLAAGEADGAPDEDVHTLVERVLYEEVGDVAGKLNTGRSRNDQVATDLRLWCLDAVADVGQEVTALGSALVDQAARGIDILLPGYTHGQRAQPVRWAYVLLAHAWPLVRDRTRLRDIAEGMSDLPLGAGALAGSGVPVDREYLRRALGFKRVAGNSLDVTGDRDFVTDTLYALAMIGVHLSRLSGELVTYASSEYGFVRLADAYSTGSSLLPQKRNPDVFELARAKSARVIGGLTGVLTLLRGLPAGYSKDLQEDKAPLFDAVDTVLATLPAVRGAVETLEPRADRMVAALDRSLLATDVADALVRGGLPFREAHALVGRLVRLGEERSADFTALPADDLDTLHPDLATVLGGLGSWEASVERRSTAGASSREALDLQFSELKRLLA